MMKQLKTKTKKRLAALALAILVAVASSPQFSNAAEPDQITKIFSGFAFEKPSLTASMKKQIKNWIKSHPGYGLVKCIGFTGQNVKERSKAFMQKLADTRAYNTCNYIHSFNYGIVVHTLNGVPGDGKTPSARRVQVTLFKLNSNSGDGGGSVIVGVCDSSLTVKMQSRISHSTFYFSTMTVSDIASKCQTRVMDVYLLDADGNQLATSQSQRILSSSLNLRYQDFVPSTVRSDQIKQVAFEIRD